MINAKINFPKPSCKHISEVLKKKNKKIFIRLNDRKIESNKYILEFSFHI